MKFIDICTAIYDYKSQSIEELSFNANDLLYIFDKSSADWYKAQLKTENSDGPTGLIPANYIEKTASIGTVKALYDYQPRSEEEVAFKENDVMTLYDRDNTNWYFIQKNGIDFGFIPSNYVELNAAPIPSNNSIIHSMTNTSTSLPKWGVALYDFNPQDKKETYLHEQEQVLVIDNISSEYWWKIEHKDGVSGIVPATYIKFHDENQFELDTIREEEKNKLEQQEKNRIMRMNEEHEKEKSRQEESERRRKMQEETKQREIESKKKQAAVAANIKPPIQVGSNSPRRSEIPAPLPPTNTNFVQNQFDNSSDPNKPDFTKVRWWTDRTGAFKVEAQILSCSNGKIRLFKTNGVRIDVPVEKMCIDDLKYVERETGQRLLGDSMPPSHIPRQSTWLDYFRKTNIPYEASVKYAKAFEKEGFSQSDLERLTYGKMKSLGMVEKHVRRLQRFIETNQAEPLSDDENFRPKPNKKKSVTFGPTTYIEDHAVIVNGDDETGGYLIFEKQDQINKDEQLARMLQEQENRQGSQIHGVGLQRRATGRAIPVQSNPNTITSNTDFNHDIQKPGLNQSYTLTSESPSIQNTNALPHQKAPSVTSQSGFDDDAWTPRPNGSSINTNTGITQPQLISRQRPAPQVSQQNLVDPQLLSKWKENESQGNVVFGQNISQNIQQPEFLQSSLNTGDNNFGRLSPSFKPQQPVLNQQNPNFNVVPTSFQNQHLTPNQLTPISTGNINNHSSTLPSLQHHQSSFNKLNSLPVGSSSFSETSPSLQNQQFNRSNSFPTGGSGFINTSPSLQQQSSNLVSPSPSLQHLQSSPSMYTASTPLHTGPPPMISQNHINMAPIQPQTTSGSNWASATPENPFGNRSLSNNSAPTLQGDFSTFNNSQNTGYLPNSVDPNDKYAIFKTINSSAPSILKPAAFSQQQTGFVNMQPQQYSNNFMNQPY